MKKPGYTEYPKSLNTSFEDEGQLIEADRNIWEKLFTSEKNGFKADINKTIEEFKNKIASLEYPEYEEKLEELIQNLQNLSFNLFKKSQQDIPATFLESVDTLIKNFPPHIQNKIQEVMLETIANLQKKVLTRFINKKAISTRTIIMIGVIMGLVSIGAWLLSSKEKESTRDDNGIKKGEILKNSPKQPFKIQNDDDKGKNTNYKTDTAKKNIIVHQTNTNKLQKDKKTKPMKPIEVKKSPPAKEMERTEAIDFIENSLKSNDSFRYTHLRNICLEYGVNSNSKCLDIFNKILRGETHDTDPNINDILKRYDLTISGAINNYAIEIFVNTKLGGIRVTKTNIAYTLTIRQKETAFRPNPLRSGESIFKYYTAELKILVDAYLLLKPSLNEKEKYWGGRLELCKTESDLYSWAQELADDLESDDEESTGSVLNDYPEIKKIILKKVSSYKKQAIEMDDLLTVMVDILRHKPAAIGAEQTNVDIVIGIAEKDLANIGKSNLFKKLINNETGKIDRELLVKFLMNDSHGKQDQMDRSIGELFVTQYYKQQIIKLHDLDGDGSLDETDITFAAAEHNAGLLSTFKAAIQSALNEEFGHKAINLDGDFGPFTEGLLIKFVQSLEKGQIIKILEKCGINDIFGRSSKKLSQEIIDDFIQKSNDLSTLTQHPIWDILITQKGRSIRIIPFDAILTTEDAKIGGIKKDYGGVEDYVSETIGIFTDFMGTTNP